MFSTLVLLGAALSAEPMLPPLLPWQGQSQTLMKDKNALATDFELSGGIASPDYEATMAYLSRLAEANPRQFQITTIGSSAQGRDIKMLVASTEGDFSTDAISASDKPTLLIQAGIHAGEIDGKDAGFMLLRDIAQGARQDILDKVNLLFVPILNVDGHERRGLFNRINQRGPVEMGFRTNAKNLNLNRDYSKLETAGIRAIADVINGFKPDLYLDVHVTDGEDYQYDITYGFNEAINADSPNIARVLDQQFRPLIDEQLVTQGHIPGPLVFAMDNKNMDKGIAGWWASPRYSNGWGDIRSLPTILVENHSLKPYRQRVLGTYVLIDALVSALHRFANPLQEAVAADSHTPDELILERSMATKPDYIPFKGIEYTHFESALTGDTEVRWLGKVKNYDAFPVYWQKEPKTRVKVPAAFYVPAQYTNVIQTLKLQGIEVEPVSDNAGRQLVRLNVTEHKFDTTPFEGRFRVNAEFSEETVYRELHGWYRVDTSQRLGKLAVHLLHPSGPDSFFRWGAFNGIFQRTEYVENYALIPYIEELFKREPELKARFEHKLAQDPEFASSPRARRDWLYSLTPYYDRAYLKYPVLMEYKSKKQ